MKPLIAFLGCICCFFLQQCIAAKNVPFSFYSSKSSLVFIENSGQIVNQNGVVRKDIQMKLQSKGMVIFIGKGQIHYQWEKTIGEKQLIGFTKENNIKTETYRLDVTLLGANLGCDFVKEEPSAFYERYYTGQDHKGILARGYTRLIYKEIYPKIDWVIYTKGNQLEYDFIVHPGGDPKNIQIKFDGQSDITLKENSLCVKTPYGRVIESAPYSYCKESGMQVASAFILKNKILTFDVPRIHGTLVIDPVIGWATYLGGAKEDQVSGIAVDNDGVYCTGSTLSTNIATTGAHQVVLNSNTTDAFIAKYDYKGNLIWCTYYGGSGTDYSYKISLSNSGNLFISGTSSSQGLATVGAFQEVMTGYYDAFIAAFTNSGQLIWGTYFGGISNEDAFAIITDRSGNVYTAGQISSFDNFNNLITPGAYKTNFGPGFIVKFDSTGKKVYSTYFDVPISSIVLDNSENVFVCGYASTNGLATAGAHQVANAGGEDAYLAKFSSSWSLQWATYFGGLVNDRATDIIADTSGIYMGGLTHSNAGIATNATHQIAYGGSSDGFLAKFNENGDLKWSTYYGGTGSDVVRAVTFNDSFVYIAGQSSSSSSIASLNGAQSIKHGLINGFTAKFSKNGKLVMGTYIGGNGVDDLRDVKTNTQGSIFVGGLTQSTGMLATNNAAQPFFGGGGFDGFLAKIHDTTVAITKTNIDFLSCLPITFDVEYSTEADFNSNNIFTVQLSDEHGYFTSPLNIGSINSPIGGTIHCVIPQSATPGNAYRIRIAATSPLYISEDFILNTNIATRHIPSIVEPKHLCDGDSLKMHLDNPVSTNIYKWYLPDGKEITAATIDKRITISDSGLWIVKAITTEGCKDSDSVFLVINTKPEVVVMNSNSPVCKDGMLALLAKSDMPGLSFDWSSPRGLYSVKDTFKVFNTMLLDSGMYDVTVTSPQGCVSEMKSIHVDIVDIRLSVEPIESKYPGDTLILSAYSNRSDALYAWTGPNNFYADSNFVVLENINRNSEGDYFVTATIGECQATSKVYVKLNRKIRVGLWPNPNNGDFYINGNVLEDQIIPFEISNGIGQTIYRDEFQTNKKRISQNISLHKRLSVGTYYLKLGINTDPRVLKFVVTD